MKRLLMLMVATVVTLPALAYGQQAPTAGALQAQIEIMNVTRQQTEAALGSALDSLRKRVSDLETENATLKADAVKGAAAAKKPEEPKK